MDSNRWISVKKVKWREQYHSTLQLRLVNMDNSSPVRVLTPGWYRIPARGECDQLAFVEMTPKRVTLEIAGNVQTKDGIAVTGKINAQVKINDEDMSIKGMVSNAEEEESLLTDSMLASAREGIITHTWQEVISTGEEFLETTRQRLVAVLNKVNSCFTVVSLAINELRPEDKAIALSLQEEQKATLERAAKKAELEGELEEQGLREEAKLAEEEARMLLESKKAQTGIIALTEKAELLKTEEGKTAAFPQEMFAQSLEELKFKTLQHEKEMSLYRELLKTTLSNQVAFQAGQFDAIRGVLAQRFDINLSEAPMLDLGEKTEARKETEEAKVEEKEADEEEPSREVQKGK